MQRAFPGIRFFYIRLYFTGFYSKMQGCVQHFLPFSGIFCKHSHSRLYKCNSIRTETYFW